MSTKNLGVIRKLKKASGGWYNPLAIEVFKIHHGSQPSFVYERIRTQRIRTVLETVIDGYSGCP